MTLKEKYPELEALLEGLIESTLSQQQADRLEAIILEDQEARRHYIQFMHLNVSLSRQYKSVEVAEAQEVVGSETDLAQPQRQLTDAEMDSPLTELQSAASIRRVQVRKTARVGGFLGRLAAAAIFLLFAGGLALFMMQNLKPAEPAAMLTYVENARWEGKAPEAAGKPLMSGQHLKLVSGLASLTFQDGSELTMHTTKGATEVVLISGVSCQLKQGEVAVNVAGENPEFTVQTPKAHIVDLGTQFSVSVNELREQVHVYHGEVTVKRKDRKDSKRMRKLKRGQAVELSESDEKDIALNYALMPRFSELNWRAAGNEILYESNDAVEGLNWKASHKKMNVTLVQPADGGEKAFKRKYGDFIRVTGDPEPGRNLMFLQRTLKSLPQETPYRIDMLVRLPNLPPYGEFFVSGSTMQEEKGNFMVGVRWGTALAPKKPLSRKQLRLLDGATPPPVKDGWFFGRIRKAVTAETQDIQTSMTLEENSAYAISIIVDPVHFKWAARVKHGKVVVDTYDGQSGWLGHVRTAPQRQGVLRFNSTADFEFDEIRIVALMD